MQNTRRVQNQANPKEGYQMPFSKTSRWLAKGLVIAVTILATALGYIPLPNFAQQTQPPAIPKVVSQEPITNEEYLKIVNEDAEALDLYKWAQQLGFTKLRQAIRLKFENDKIVILGTFRNEKDNTELNLTRSENPRKSYLAKFDPVKKTATLFDRQRTLIITEDVMTILDEKGNVVATIPLKKGFSLLDSLNAYAMHSGTPIDDQCPGSARDGHDKCMERHAVEITLIIAAAIAGCVAEVGIGCAVHWVIAIAHITYIGAECLNEGYDEVAALQDLILSSINVVDAGTGAPVSEVRFGQNVQLEVRVVLENRGGAGRAVPGATVLVKLPTGNQTTSQVLPAGTTPLTPSPKFGTGGLQPGSYAIEAIVDPSNVVCEAEDNASGISQGKKGPFSSGGAPVGANNTKTWLLRITARDPSVLRIKEEVVNCGKATGCVAGDSMSLTARLTYPDPNAPREHPIRDATITWDVTNSAGTIVPNKCQTDGNGECPVTYKHTMTNPIDFKIIATFGGNTIYERSTAEIPGKGGGLLQPPGLPDLTVTSLFLGKPRIDQQGCDVMATATIRNVGTADAGPFTVVFFVDGRPEPGVLIEQGLKAGQALVLNESLRASGLSVHAIDVFVDSKNEIKESDETNNKASKTADCRA